MRRAFGSAVKIEQIMLCRKTRNIEPNANGNGTEGVVTSCFYSYFLAPYIFNNNACHARCSSRSHKVYLWANGKESRYPIIVLHNQSLSFYSIVWIMLN